jgi:hypothetical protein
VTIVSIEAGTRRRRRASDTCKPRTPRERH